MSRGHNTPDEENGTSTAVRRRAQSDAIVALTDAAAAPDVAQFAALCESIDWKRRSASEILHAIRLALKAGAVMVARQLATEGASYQPEDEELQKYARILAPPEIVRTNLPPDPAIEANFAWFKRHRAEHHGRWVALRAGVLVAEGATFEEVLAKMGGIKEKKGLLLTRVD